MNELLQKAIELRSLCVAVESAIAFNTPLAAAQNIDNRVQITTDFLNLIDAQLNPPA